MQNYAAPLFSGIGTALITPFTAEDKIDYGAFGRLIDRQVAAGISALVVAGTTGEGATLTDQEKCRMTAFAKERVAGRIPVYGNCGSNNTRRAVALAGQLERAGADGLLAVTPYYNKATDDGLYIHYRAIADATDLPLMLYHVPSRTGCRITMEDYRKLAAIESIRAVKEASSDLRLLCDLTTELGSRFAVYAGNDSDCLPAGIFGAAGCVSVLSNLCPHACVSFWNACCSGDRERAHAQQTHLLPKMQALFWEVNPVPVKYVAAKLGHCRLAYRSPLSPPATETARRLDELFDL